MISEQCKKKSMIHITKQLDGQRLLRWQKGGYAAAVLEVPMDGHVMECAFRMVDLPSHTAPVNPPRAATLDEVAECVHAMSCLVEGGAP